MAQRNKKTTMAKLNREHKLRERRIDKQARKDARKQAASDDSPVLDENGVAVPAGIAESPEPEEA